MDFRSIAREHHEDALQIVRDIAKARRQKIPIKLRKKVEMLSQRRERTPGQYRKDIRPLETRRLALQARAPISSVAFDVGDESPAHFSLPGFTSRDITAWKREIAELSGIRFVGVSAIA
jgi:AraC-like DNA-binding protein